MPRQSPLQRNRNSDSRTFGRVSKAVTKGITGLAKRWTPPGLVQAGKVFSYLGVLLTGVLFGILLLAMVLAGQIYEYEDTVSTNDVLPAVDAVVVLAGAKGRLAAGGDIWYRYWQLSRSRAPGPGRKPIVGKIPLLYISGAGPQMQWPTFSRHLRRAVLQVIEPKDVILETESGNTEENGLFLAANARARGWKSVLLVTSSYHMKRARSIFERIFAANGVDLDLETASILVDPYEPGDWRTGGLLSIRVTLWEYLKWVYYSRIWIAPVGLPRPLLYR